MTRKKRYSGQKFIDQEKRIQEVITTFKNNEIPSIRRAVTIFNVPYGTLRDRLNGHEF